MEREAGERDWDSQRGRSVERGCGAEVGAWGKDRRGWQGGGGVVYPQGMGQ